jgi:hypothetical protein
MKKKTKKSPKLRQRVKSAVKAKPGPPKGAKHFVEYVALGGHSDSFSCICGWKSNGYWDLVEAAWDEWLLHAHDTKTEVREVDKERQAKIVAAREKHRSTLKANRDSLNARIAKLGPK